MVRSLGVFYPSISILWAFMSIKGLVIQTPKCFAVHSLLFIEYLVFRKSSTEYEVECVQNYLLIVFHDLWNDRIDSNGTGIHALVYILRIYYSIVRHRFALNCKLEIVWSNTIYANYQLVYNVQQLFLRSLLYFPP